MTTWVDIQKRTWAEWAVIRILKVGPMPKHLAIIMDGNRRYARQNNKETEEAHSAGFVKLAQVLGWCRDLDINEVTVYAFSIENFKRSQREVESLMNLAAEKFQLLLEKKDELNEHGICIRVLGNVDLLPEKVRKMIAEAVVATHGNTKCFLNLAIAYTSQEEMTRACMNIYDGVKMGKLKSSDLSESLFERCLYTGGIQDPDLLIRTSGEVRLSDFLLWQCAFSCLFFTKVLWPDISIWHLFGAIFYYQRHFHTLSAARNQCLVQRMHDEQESVLKECKIKYGEKVTQDVIDAYSLEKMRRCNSFVSNLYNERLQHFEHLCS